MSDSKYKSFNDKSDFELIKEFNSGNVYAFEVLVYRHKLKVQNLIYLTLGNTDYAEDILQDVFIQVFNSLNNFRFESKFSTWLYKITVNKCKDHLKKKYIRKVFVPIEDIKHLHSKDVNNVDPDFHTILFKAIEKLPPKLKEPLILRDINELSYKEIAKKMNLDIGAVKSRIFRARTTLKALLQPYLNDEF